MSQMKIEITARLFITVDMPVNAFVTGSWKFFEFEAVGNLFGTPFLVE